MQLKLVDELDSSSIDPEHTPFLVLECKKNACGVMQSLDNLRLWCWCDSMQSLCELTDDQWKSMQIPEGFVNAHCGSPLRADGVIGFKVQLDIYGATRSHRGRSDELDGENSHSHQTYARLTAQKLSTERDRIMRAVKRTYCCRK